MRKKSLFDLSNKVAVITGSSRGIGLAIAEQMASAGAKVVISSRKVEACEQAAETIRSQGGQALVIPANVSDQKQLDDLIEQTLEAWGQIDILVCNAASNPYFGPLSGLTDEVFNKIMHNNVLSSIRLIDRVAPDMAKRKQGSIIIISSIGGMRGDALLGTYNMSKAANMQLVRSAAVEWGRFNVRVNAIAPGLIRTDFARALWDNPEMRMQIEHSTPLARIGNPADVGGIAVFLASPAAAFVTGQVIVADGGLTVSAVW